MSRVSFDNNSQPRESMRALTRVSALEEKKAGLNRASGRYNDILDSIENDEGWTTEALAQLTFRDIVVKILDSTPFQAAMASCIMLNAAVIGGETDFPDLELWHPIETTFLIIFSTELFLRMVATGVRGFFAPGEDQLWNLFDFGIVGLGIFDVVCEKLGGQHHPAHGDGDSKHQGGGLSTLFRMIRLLRILRIFKIVRFLKQLYMLAFGFVEAIQAICWVSTLMFFVLYLCSIIMVRIYGKIAYTQKQEIADVLTEQFGSIKISMLSLFELMSNPGNLLLYHVLMGDFPFLTLFLIAFVIFGSFGMIAMLTGIISESMFEKNQTRASEERQEREQKRETLKQKCIELFETVEKDEEEEASPQDLEEVLPYVREMFEKLDLEYMEHDFDNIITLCDTDDNGSISEAEFVSGILSLCDGVRAASIQEVYYLLSQMNAKIKRIEVNQDEIQRMTKKTIPEMQGELTMLRQRLESQPQLPPISNTVSNGFNPSSLTQSAETRLSEMRASLTNTMDHHTELLSKKLDDLNTNVAELCKTSVAEICKKPEPLTHDIFSFGRVSPQVDSSGKADVECPPTLPEWCLSDLENNPKEKVNRSFFSGERISPPAASTVRSITPLASLPAADNAKGLL